MRRRGLLFDSESKSAKWYDNYMTVEALEDGLIVSLVIDGYGTTIEYSLDGKIWTPIYDNAPSINTGEIIAFRGNGIDHSKEDVGIGIFRFNCKCNLLGNCMSLLYGDGALIYNTVSDYAFNRLFSNATNIISVSKNFLPATTLAVGCYGNMFSGCTNLTVAPELSATTLVNGCYNYMFYGCTSLVNAPELPATILASYCYSSMFYGCTKLNYIKMLATDISADGCLDYWVNRVASTGTFVKNAAMTALPTGISGIPSGWTVQNA